MPVEHYFGLRRVTRTLTVIVTAMTIVMVAAMVNIACLLSARRPAWSQPRPLASGRHGSSHTPASWRILYATDSSRGGTMLFLVQSPSTEWQHVLTHGLTLITRLTVLYGPVACNVTAVLVVTV
jgi:hypothetical protein